MKLKDESIVIVDYGMGNLGSIQNMLKKIGRQPVISADIPVIEKADKLILGGVGAFDNAMTKLNELKLVEILNRKVLHEEVPVLGICLGMQLLTRSSEEGRLPGFGWIDAATYRFNFENGNGKLKVPHMGWNSVEMKKQNVLFEDICDEPRFYFVHSYHLAADQEEDVVSTTDYGYPFTSVVNKKNIFGVQFHPEKSHKYGMKLLQNFMERV